MIVAYAALGSVTSSRALLLLHVLVVLQILFQQLSSVLSRFFLCDHLLEGARLALNGASHGLVFFKNGRLMNFKLVHGLGSPSDSLKLSITSVHGRW